MKVSTNKIKLQLDEECHFGHLTVLLHFLNSATPFNLLILLFLRIEILGKINGSDFFLKF